MRDNVRGLVFEEADVVVSAVADRVEQALGGGNKRALHGAGLFLRVLGGEDGNKVKNGDGSLAAKWVVIAVPAVTMLFAIFVALKWMINLSATVERISGGLLHYNGVVFNL